MSLQRRWATVALAAGVAGASLGCPSLSEIGVGGDAGSDGRTDAGGDVLPREARGPDAVEEKACTKDPASDPKNCGRCGHDCERGACEGGVCQPYALVTGIDGPYGVAVTNGTVYFTSPPDGMVYMCKVDACDLVTVMTSGQAFPRGITTDSTTVYWADLGNVDDPGFAGSIETCGLAGCPGGGSTPLTALDEDGPIDLAVNVSTVYWPDDYGGVVRSCAIGGCDDMPTTLATDSSKLLSGVAIDTTDIFWGEPTNGNLIKCPLDGCTTFTPFASFPSCMFTHIDIVNGTVFWTTQTEDGQILSCPTSGCTDGKYQVFASAQPYAFAITHDATNLYWTLFNVGIGGKVLRCPLAGCTTPTVLAENQAQPSAIAIDDTSIYWANSGGTTVMRLMK
jgi:hypothetical protein